MNRTPILALACSLALPALALPGLAGAAVVQSGPNDRNLAFEAEAFDVVGDAGAVDFELISDSAASGGSAIRAAGSGQGAAGDDSFVSYTLTFLNDGTSGDPYDLYVRRRVENNGNSAFQPDDFDVDPTGGAFNLFDNGSANATYEYRFEGQYQVTAGETVTFTFKPREVGYVIDRFVLSRDSNLNDAQLDAIENDMTAVIPEPATAGLAVAGLGALALRRRK